MTVTLSAMVDVDQCQHVPIKTRLGLFAMAVATTHQAAVKQAKLPTVPTGGKKSTNDKKNMARQPRNSQTKRVYHFTGLVLSRVCPDVCKQWLSCICSQQKKKNTQCVYGVKGVARRSLNQIGFIVFLSLC